jgi:2-polyprenyl-3-methyl-5-hydroxy-6-metoxy-1,4-benzoquinol methylase
MADKKLNTQTERVKSYFEEPTQYLGRRGFDIRIRLETVQELLQQNNVGQALDIGCGDGSISLPLLQRHQAQHLTLLDMSANMLELARKSIPAGMEGSVKFLNENFMAAELDTRGYDVIICLGVLAHVDSTQDVITRISHFLKPGGLLILEVTDSYHPVGFALAVYHRIINCLKTNNHKLNWLSANSIINTCLYHQLTPTACYKYSLPPPGSHRLFSQENLYRMTRKVFGSDLENNRNKWLGYISIYKLEKKCEPA